MMEVTLKDLLEAGCHFGHQARRWNPKMKKYIYGERGGVHIIDLVQTKKSLDDACGWVKKLASEGKTVLFVGTKRQAAGVVGEQAIRVGMPYLTQRWVGGLLTNWQEISKRIKKLHDMKEKREKGEYKVYTKKEQLLLDREIAKLEKFLGGVAGLEKLPDALFVVDTHREEVAVLEANRMGIPVVGVVDTNADPEIVDWVIPSNDDAVKAIELIVRTIADAIENAKVKSQNAKAQVKSEN
ncbi:30S ribosomal protein S2 [Candidatus Amesbacteria bacterium]|nr:30S ribosomal protein S2 [Candidatus Amesbacteria bacterium]